MADAPASPERGALSLTEIRAVWPLLTHADRLAAFALLPQDEAQSFFAGLDARDQEEVIRRLPGAEQRAWIHLLPPG
jgi:Mg/Co/Ni transporter MgtE